MKGGVDRLVIILHFASKHLSLECRNAETAHWFSFDDNEVEELVSAE